MNTEGKQNKEGNSHSQLRRLVLPEAFLSYDHLALHF